MTKWLLLLLALLVSAPAALAQSSDYSRYEFYGGYAYQRVNNTAAPLGKSGIVVGNHALVVIPGDIINIEGRDENYHGFTGEFNRNLNRHWGLVTSFTGAYDKASFVSGIAGITGTSTSRYDLMFGPRYNFRLGRINPFAEGMAGFEHTTVRFKNKFGSLDHGDTAFAMAFGGGVDVQVSQHFDIRAIQADYVPTFFNNTHQNNYRVGAGVKVKLVDP